ncbi:MAG TPA: hypothetical protein VKB53_10120 [Gammaproteobacteria bacterium]|nr:hypothetical protein [Gammaproteobacteria bacterium]
MAGETIRDFGEDVQLGEYSELASFADMLVHVANEILSRGNIKGAAASIVISELSCALRSICARHQMSARESHMKAESARQEMTALLALLKMQVIIAPETTNASARLMSMYELLRGRLASERSRYEQMAKEATRALSPARRAMLLFEWTDRLRDIADDTALNYSRRYNNSAAAMPEDLADIVPLFIRQTEAAWRAYLWKLRSQTWLDGCQRIFGLRSPA